MSWNFSCIGKAENVARAIDAYSEKLSGQCLVEYDAAKPHLIALVRENFAKQEPYIEPVIDFEASGSGSTVGGEQVQRSCTVSIKPLWKQQV